MKNKKVQSIISITLLNYVTWLLLTAGILSVESWLISTVAYLFYMIIIFLIGDKILVQIVKTRDFNEAGDLYDVLNYSCNSYQQKYGIPRRNIKFYYFEYEKPISFAFGKKAIFVSSSITRLRQLQQSQLCMQSVAEIDSMRGLANLEVILGNPVIVGSFIFLYVGKWIIYLQLLMIKIMFVIMIVLFEWMTGMATRIFFNTTYNSLSGLWMLRFSSLFSVNKISDVIYLVTCNILTHLLKILSYGQIAFVRSFDSATDKMLSGIWSKSEFENYLDSSHLGESEERVDLTTDRLRLLCSVVEAHINPIKRKEKLESYYSIIPQHRITIHRSDDRVHNTRRIRIQSRENGGHHEN